MDFEHRAALSINTSGGFTQGRIQLVARDHIFYKPVGITAVTNTHPLHCPQPVLASLMRRNLHNYGLSKVAFCPEVEVSIIAERYGLGVCREFALEEIVCR